MEFFIQKGLYYRCFPRSLSISPEQLFFKPSANSCLYPTLLVIDVSNINKTGEQLKSCTPLF